jgi:hypothetical protein
MGDRHVDSVCCQSRLRTFAVRVGSHVQTLDVVGWHSFEPDLLPDARARAVENVARAHRLLANGYNLGICWVMDKHQPCICQPQGSPRRSWQWINLHRVGPIQPDILGDIKGNS